MAAPVRRMRIPRFSRFVPRFARRWLAGGVALLLMGAGASLAFAQATPAAPTSPTPARPTARPGGPSAAGTAAAAAKEYVMWAGLLFADVAGTDPTVRGGELKIEGKWPAALAGRDRQISKIFGYRRLRLLGQERQRIRTGEEDWVLRTKAFVVKVDTRKATKTGYEVLIQVLQEEKLLVEVTVKELPRTSSPVYIKGPQVNSGQLIIALVCGDKDAPWTKPRPRATPKPTVTPTAAPESSPTATSPNSAEIPTTLPTTAAPSPAPTP